MTAASKRKPQTALAPIEPGACYPLKVFMARTGIGTAAMREACRQGLRVIHKHGRGFVMGYAWIEYIEMAPKGDGEGERSGVSGPPQA